MMMMNGDDKKAIWPPPVGFSFSLLTLRFEAMLLSRGVAEDKEPKTKRETTVVNTTL
jgi:hypothetical protein